MNLSWWRSGTVRAAVDTVRRSKGRSFWTMSGIIIGVMSVISIVSIGQGIKKQVGVQIHNYGSNLITVKTAQLGSGSNSGGIEDLSGFSVTAPLNGSDVHVISRVKHVLASAPLTLVSGGVYGDNGKFNKALIIGTSPDLPSLLNQSLAYGSFFSAGQLGSQVAVIGQNAANNLFNENVPLGRGFTVHGQSFIVEGIFNQFSSAPLSQQADLNNAIFIPNTVAESMTNNTAPTYEVLARADKKANVNSTAAAIKKALNNAHGGSSGFQVLTGNQNLQSNNSILSLLTSLTAGVAAISLLVAGIGIMNVMLVSVSERVREIGIKKAVGATNRQIRNQFMVESALISFMGGLLGVIAAIVIDVMISVATNLRPAITWQIVVLAIAISLVVGIIFGTVPAVKAAKKDPIDALRAE